MTSTMTRLAVAACAVALIATPVQIGSVGSAQAAARATAGAHVPFTEYAAEDGKTNGTVIGPDRAYGTLAAEVVGRQAVRLDAKGEYVEVTLKKAANAVNVRYSIPDSADGKGLDASLGVYVNGRRSGSLALTSRYSWYYGQYPWTNNPADGGRRQL